MERLQMCRMCLVEDATMYVVDNKNLLRVYEKLTGKPFVTEDRRPVLVCYFCCSKLKECCRFWRKCLKAEELLAQMLDEDYEPNPLINPEILAFNNGLVISPMEHVNIVGESQTEIRAVKEDLLADCERVADIINNGLVISPMVHINIVGESQTEIRAVNEELLAECERVADIIEPKEELKDFEVETELENPDLSDIEDISVHHSHSKDDVSITEFKTEVEEELVTNCTRAPVAKKPKLRLRRTKLEDVITEEQTKNELSDIKVIWTTKNRTSPAVPNLDPLIYKNPTVNKIFDSSKSVNNENVKKQICKDGNKNDISFKITNTEKYSHNVNRHRKLCVKNQPYKCEVCQFRCNQKSNLTKHVRKHTGDKPYKCEVCQYSCNTKDNLAKHIRIHTGDKPYKCEICQYSCNHKSGLKIHNRIHTGETPYKCEICQYSCKRKGGLKTHIRLHTGEKPYKCEICQYSCNQKSNLTKHVRIHTGDKPYKCEICQSSFRVKNILETHILQHTGETPFKCEICKRSFKQKHVLTKHVRIHTGEKPYKCEVCQRSFKQKHVLTRHIQIHTGEKPYKCEICQRSFRRKHVLSSHIRIHMGEKP